MMLSHGTGPPLDDNLDPIVSKYFFSLEEIDRHLSGVSLKIIV